MIFSSDNGGANKAGGYNNPLRGEKSELWDGGIKSGIVSREFPAKFSKISDFRVRGPCLRVHNFVCQMLPDPGFLPDLE